MRYIKKFNENNSWVSIISEEISDILLEVTDLGYYCHIETSQWTNNRNNSVRICIYGKEETIWDNGYRLKIGFLYPDEVLETIERLVSYLESIGYYLGDSNKKELETIRNIKSLEKNKKEIVIKLSLYSQIILVWDDKINNYKIQNTISLSFRK